MYPKVQDRKINFNPAVNKKKKYSHSILERYIIKNKNASNIHLNNEKDRNNYNYSIHGIKVRIPEELYKVKMQDVNDKRKFIFLQSV